MHPLLTTGLIMLAALLAGAGGLHLLARLGKPGRAVCDWLAHAPGLDVLIFYFTAIPLVVGPVAGARTIDAWWGWLAGLGIAIASQVVMLMVWTVLHELAHPEARKKRRLVHQINSSVGRWRNHTAVWVTAMALPVFAFVRIAELIVNPLLHLLVGLPKYKQAEWVNVSRHKFEGLIGHDLIWCLYCDWMTGVWSLGTEMLRNVESFWCPIRFDSSKKCVNCTLDFPDIDGGWVAADATIEDVVATHAKHYPGPGGANAWFGHPARQSASLTVEGEPVEDEPVDDQGTPE